MRRTRKPKKAKSKRPSLLEWFAELVGKPSTATKGEEAEKRTPSGHSSRAFGANQLFGEQENGQPLPSAAAVATTPLLDIDALPSHAHHNSVARQGPQLQLKRISSQRLSINQGCKSWTSFYRMTAPLTTRRRNLVEGRVQKVRPNIANKQRSYGRRLSYISADGENS
jgi:hypothetical protein